MRGEVRVGGVAVDRLRQQGAGSIAVATVERDQALASVAIGAQRVGGDQGIVLAVGAVVVALKAQRPRVEGEHLAVRGVGGELVGELGCGRVERAPAARNARPQVAEQPLRLVGVGAALLRFGEGKQGAAAGAVALGAAPLAASDQAGAVVPVGRLGRFELLPQIVQVVAGAHSGFQGVARWLHGVGGGGGHGVELPEQRAAAARHRRERLHAVLLLRLGAQRGANRFAQRHGNQRRVGVGLALGAAQQVLRAVELARFALCPRRRQQERAARLAARVGYQVARRL